MALGLVVVLAIGAAFALGSRSGDDPETAERTSVDRGTDAEDTETTVERSTTTTDAPRPTTTLPAAPVLSTAPPATPPPHGPEEEVPVPGGGRTWVAMRSSLADEAAARSLAAEIAGAYVFRSDEYASLRAGYWVVAVGTYATSDEALDYCRVNGLYDDHDCVALPLSQDPADVELRPHL